MHIKNQNLVTSTRSSHQEMFLGKGVLKIGSKFTGELPCRSAISIKLQSNFIENTLRHGCSPVNLPHIFRKHLLKNTFGRLLLQYYTFTGDEISTIQIIPDQLSELT